MRGLMAKALKRPSARPARRGNRRAKSATTADRAPGRGKYDRTRTRDEREREQRRRLLQSAAHVFATKGWADATVEAIVTHAGMSRRTFYEHFSDLETCLKALHERVTRIAFRAVEVAVQAQATPGDMLRMGVRAFLGSIAAYPDVARVMFHVVRSAGPQFEEAHARMMERFETLVFDGVAHSYDVGTAKRAPDEIRVHALVAGMEAVGMRYVTRGEEAKALDAADTLIDMVEKTFS